MINSVNWCSPIVSNPVQIALIVFSAGYDKAGHGDFLLKLLGVGGVYVFGMSSKTEIKSA